MCRLQDPVPYYQERVERDSFQLDHIWKCALTAKHEAVAAMILERDPTLERVRALLSRGMHVPPELVPVQLYADVLALGKYDDVLPQLLRQTPTLKNISAWLTSKIRLPPTLFEQLLTIYPFLSENPWAQLIYTLSACKLDLQLSRWFEQKRPGTRIIKYDSRSGRFNFPDSLKRDGPDFSSDQKKFRKDQMDVLEAKGLYWHHPGRYDGEVDEPLQFDPFQGTRVPAPVVPEAQIQAGNRGAVGNDVDGHDVADANGDSKDDSDESVDEGDNGARDHEELKQEREVFSQTRVT
jgi:hypothetical protein